MRSNILSMDPMSDIDRAYYLILQVKKQREITSTSLIKPTAFYASNTNNKKDWKKFKETSQKRDSVITLKVMVTRLINALKG